MDITSKQPAVSSGFDARQQKILNRISPLTYKRQQSEHIKQRYPGTGRSLLESTDYKTWIQTPGQTLFCTGLPGAGKTVATSTVVEDLEVKFQEDSNTAVLYVYFDYLSQERDHVDLLRRLIRQLAENQPSELLKLEIKFDKRDSDFEIPEIFGYIISRHSRTFVILDGLDEVLDPSRETFLGDLLHAQRTHRVNIFVTSRSRDFSEKFANTTVLDFRAEEHDIRNYAAGTLQKSPYRSLDNGPDDETVSRIAQLADGRFLLAKLLLDSVTSTPSPESLQVAVAGSQSGPEAYDSAYKAVMARVDAQTKDRAQLGRISLSWLAFATRPLTLPELQHALAFTTRSGRSRLVTLQKILSSTGGLAVAILDNGIQRMRLIHQTAQQFLRRHLQDTEQSIGIICAKYLSKKKFTFGPCKTDKRLQKRILSNALYEYAAQNWGHYLREAPKLVSVENMKFLRFRRILKAALQAAFGTNVFDSAFLENFTAVHFASYSGATGVVASLLSAGNEDINALDGWGYTPLSWAAKCGHLATLKLLLSSNGIDINIQNSKERTPLTLAAIGGYTPIVEELLSRGADQNLSDYYNATPLWYASERCHSDIVRLLVARKPSDVNVRSTRTGYKKHTPLSVAVEKSYIDVVTVLLPAENIDPQALNDISEWPYTSPLEIAVSRYEDAAISIVKKEAAKSDEQTGGKPTLSQDLLVKAAGAGHERLVSILLKMFEMSPNYVAERGVLNGWTALMAAARNGHEAVVRLLLDTSGPDSGLQHEDNESTEIPKESSNWNLSVASILGDGKVDPDLEDSSGRTALFLAAKYGHEAVVTALLENGRVNPNRRNKRGVTPLACSITSRGIRTMDERIRIVKRLVDVGADPNFPDGEPGNRDSETNLYSTPLLHAVQTRNAELVSALSDCPRTNLNYHPNGVVTPFALAVSMGLADVIDALVQTGCIDLNIGSGHEESAALFFAAQNGHKDIVETILSFSGIDPDKKNKTGRTPLAVAANRGHKAIVERLLSVTGVDLDSRDGHGQSPLSIAASARHTDIVKLFLEFPKIPKLQTDRKDNDGRTPLSLAAEHGHVEVVKQLLSGGRADPGLKDHVGRTPLSWAVNPGPIFGLPWRGQNRLDQRVKVVEILLQQGHVGLNVEDDEGLTPVTRAIRTDHDGQLAGILLRHNVNLDYRNMDNLSYLQIAQDIGNTAFARSLLSRGAMDTGDRETRNLENHDDRAIGLHETSTVHGALDPDNEHDANLTSVSNRSSPISLAESEGLSEESDAYERQQRAEDLVLTLGSQEHFANITEPGSDNLCVTCAAIDFDRAFSLRLLYKRGQKIADLGHIDETWTTRSCSFCRLIGTLCRNRKQMEWRLYGGQSLFAYSMTKDWLWPNTNSNIHHFRRPWIDTTVLSISDTDHFHSSVATGTIARLGSNCPMGEQAVTVPKLANSIDYQAIKSWIACCDENHSELCPPHSTVDIPHFRLIKCDTREVVFLNKDSSTRFVALSYVCGALPDAPDFKHGQSIGDNVEPVVEDAIIVTQKLGYEFLWVDRYCIAQKDKDLKPTQMMSMNLIYAAADVTIIAVAGVDASYGLPGVSERRAREEQLCTTVKSHVLTTLPPDFNRIVKRSKWSKRGWTYQEGVLSRRRVFFSDCEVWYECRGLLCRESILLPKGLQRQMCSFESRVMEYEWTFPHTDVIGSDNNGRGLFKLLEEYTPRQLSFEKDILDAMLGILKVYSDQDRKPIYNIRGVPVLCGEKWDPLSAETTGSTLAGFTTGLAWKLLRHGSRRRGFPSWSWAGWKRKVYSGVPKYYFTEESTIDVSIVLDDMVMSWKEYDGLSKVEKETKFSQTHMLDITAFVMDVTVGSNEESFPLYRNAHVHVDGECLSEKLELLQDPSLDAEFRHRLSKETWIGVLLGTERNYSQSWLLLVQECLSRRCWERVGMVTVGNKLETDKLERLTIRLG